MKRIKSIESTVTSLVKAFESVGAEVYVDGSYVSNSQYVTIFDDGLETLKIRVSDHSLPDCYMPSDYHLTTGNLDPVSYQTSDWWRVAEKVAERLGYSIPRSVKIARSLFMKKEERAAERMLVSAAEKRELENESFINAYKAIVNDPSIIERIMGIDALNGAKRRHAREKFNSRYAKVADWLSFCRAGDKYLENKAWMEYPDYVEMPTLTAEEEAAREKAMEVKE